jgi:hypothetical protein
MRTCGRSVCWARWGVARRVCCCGRGSGLLCRCWCVCGCWCVMQSLLQGHKAVYVSRRRPWQQGIGPAAIFSAAAALEVCRPGTAGSPVLCSSKHSDACTHLGHKLANSRCILHPRSPQPVPGALAAAPCSCCCFDLNCSTARQLRLRVTQGMLEQHVLWTGMRVTAAGTLCYVR